MLKYVVKALEPVFKNIFVIAGYKAELLKTAFPETSFIIQEQQLGTGHALMTAFAYLDQTPPEYVFVINADTPLVTAREIENILNESWGADLAFATLTLEDPHQFGRIVRKNGEVRAIIEAKDYDESIHGPVSGEINAGIYLLKFASIKKLLPLLGNSNRNNEYYITDLVGLALEAGLSVKAINCGNNSALLGVNSPGELALAEDALAVKIVHTLLNDNVILHSPHSLRVGPWVKIAPGAEIYGPSQIFGDTVIEADAIIEAFCKISDSTIRSFSRIRSFSHLEKCDVHEHAIIGPYARLRPGAIIEKNAHVGNFVELKKTTLGEGSKANHLTYLGDATVGAGVNIGAGTITCNYDGKNKFPTVIGDNAFIGSNSSLVAPVTIGENSLVGAGSVITRDVPKDSLAIERNHQKILKRRFPK